MKKILKKILILVFIGALIYINVIAIEEISFHNNYGSSSATVNSEKIGTLTLFASPISIPTVHDPVGHSWVLIENTSDSPIYVANVEVKPNESISLGTTAMPNMQHKGIWTNVEGYNSYYKNNISISGNFYKEDLDYLNEYLKHHDKWTLAFNCVSFATGIWNNSLAGANEQFHAILPVQLYIEMLDSDNYVLDYDFSVSKKPAPYNENPN